MKSSDSNITSPQKLLKTLCVLLFCHVDRFMTVLLFTNIQNKMSSVILLIAQHVILLIAQQLIVTSFKQLRAERECCDELHLYIGSRYYQVDFSNPRLLVLFVLHWRSQLHLVHPQTSPRNREAALPQRNFAAVHTPLKLFQTG